MKLGVVADVHGNLVALDAVLEDAAALGVDRWWALGDLVLFGPRPVETLRRLSELPGIQFVRGNTDRYVLTDQQPYPHETAADAMGNLDLVERFAWMAAQIGWARGALLEGGGLESLDSMQAGVRETLPDGTRLLGIHASPGSDDGPGIDTDSSDEALERLVAGCEADIVVGGHTHDRTDRMVGGVRVVNGGSVGLPRRSNGAGWVLITADESGVDVDCRVVEFAVEKVVDDLHLRRYPNPSFLTSVLRREHAFAH